MILIIGAGMAGLACARRLAEAGQAAIVPDKGRCIGGRLATRRVGVTPDCVTHAVAHRWRYARVTQALGQPSLRSADGTHYLGGDWCIGPGAEAAWTSGTAISDAILAQG